MTYTWNEYGRPSIYTAMSVGAEVAAGEIDGWDSFHLFTNLSMENVLKGISSFFCFQK